MLSSIKLFSKSLISNKQILTIANTVALSHIIVELYQEP